MSDFSLTTFAAKGTLAFYYRETTSDLKRPCSSRQGLNLSRH